MLRPGKIDISDFDKQRIIDAANALKAEGMAETRILMELQKDKELKKLPLPRTVRTLKAWCDWDVVPRKGKVRRVNTDEELPKPSKRDSLDELLAKSKGYKFELADMEERKEREKQAMLERLDREYDEKRKALQENLEKAAELLRDKMEAARELVDEVAGD